jgi:hypothetical protein
MSKRDRAKQRRRHRNLVIAGSAVGVALAGMLVAPFTGEATEHVVDSISSGAALAR